MNRCHASSDSLQSENPLSTVSTLAPIAEFFPYPSRMITIASEYDDRPAGRIPGRKSTRPSDPCSQGSLDADRRAPSGRAQATLNAAQLNLEFTRVTDIAPVYGLTGVFLCAEEVERNIILITENPAIVPRRDVKQIAGSHFDN